ncbi:MAG: AEC family transporter, partial [Dyella sp.]|nr:AEC family transporter [Dyella sp.]
MFTRIVSIITPVILIILIGWLYGRRAHPDMTGINRATLEVIAPLLVVSAFISKDFVLADQLVLLACAVAVVIGSGLLALAVARMIGAKPRTFVPPMMFNNCGNMGLPLS